MVNNRVKTIGDKKAVWKGEAYKTSGGLTKKDLTISRSSGKVVSKKQQAQGHKLAKNYPPERTRAAPFTKRT